MGVYRVDKLMSEARKLAAEYRKATGRTLAISGEIAINDAVVQLGLEPAPRDAEGYDAPAQPSDCRSRAALCLATNANRIGWANSSSTNPGMPRSSF